MIRQFISASFLLALISIPIFAQTAPDLERKYGPPIKVFQIRSGIFMTVKYDDVGQVCEMVIERRLTTESRVDLDSTLPDPLVKELIDELAPVNTRGKRIDKGYMDKSYFDTKISGDLKETEYRYENFTIRLIGNLSNGTKVLIITRTGQGSCTP
jgi:hypothetical protein